MQSQIPLAKSGLWAVGALAILGLTACLHVPPPHQRALEANELCAQYLAAGELEKAEVQCDLGLQFSPEYADLWTNKGLIALKRGQLDLAKEHFIRALRYNQEQAQAYNNLGYIYLKEQQYGKAHDSFTRALKVNPDYIEARYNLALTYKEMKMPAKARKEYMTIIAIRPDLADAHHDLGLIAYEEGSYADAIEHFSKAVQLEPKYADAWMNLGVTYAAAGRYTEARDAFISCLEADKDNIPCRQNLPIVARKEKLLSPSLKELQEGESAENTAPAMYALAVSYRERGLRNEEERTFKKCVGLDNKYAPCHYGLYLIFKEERRDQEATIACQNFIKFALAEEFPKEVETCERYVSSR